MLLFDQTVYAVERHATVIPDNTPPAICIRKPGDNASVPRFFHFVGIGVEYTVVVGFAVFEDLVHLGVGFFIVSLQGVFNHTVPAEGHDCAFERFIGLEPDNRFQLPVDITGLR